MHSFLSDAAVAAEHTGWLTSVLLDAARGGAEWILWLLVILSLVSVGVFVERRIFLRRVSASTEGIRQMIIAKLGAGDVDGLVAALADDDSMHARVVAYGLREAERGPEAVIELCRGAIGVEKLRYERGLNVLATVGSNAPFVGLFGTVMGVIMAFDQLRGMGSANPDASNAVMGAIAEALVATGVGLLVAIPAIVFYNMLKSEVKKASAQTALLVETSVAYLRSRQAN